MTTQSESPLDPTSRKRAEFAVGVACALLGAAVFASWLIGWDLQGTVVPGSTTMKANTALCFVLLGTALAASSKRAGTTWEALPTAFAILTLVIALTSASQTVLGFDAGIDELLIGDPESRRLGLPPGRMSLVNAVELTVATLALLFDRGGWWRAAHGLSITGLAVASTHFVAFGYLGRSAARIAPYASISVLSFLAFTVLFSTLAVTTSRGLVASVVLGQSSGARMIRRFGVPLVLGTWTLGLVTMTLAGRGYPPEFFLTAHQALSSSLALGLLVATARSLSQTEAGIRRDEQRFRAFVEASPDALVITDLSGTIVSHNSEFARLFGQAPSTGTKLESWIDPSSRADHVRERERRLAAGLSSPLWRQSVACTGLQHDERRIALEMRFARVRLPNEDVLLHTLRDVTERDRLSERNLHISKMAAVGQLAGGIAHDYNNIVAVILSYASFLKERVAGIPDAQRDVDEVLKAADKARMLSRQLLSFSPQHILDVTVSNLSGVVKGARGVLEATLGADVQLAIVDPEDTWPARVDRAHFVQILTSLARNAREAMPHGGSFTLRLENRHVDEEQARQMSDLRAGDYVVISATDTGSGMSAETSARAFEPFFTTKHRGQSAGLGLPMCYGVVRQLGGCIAVESELDRGTTVHLFLPRAAEAAGLSSGTRRLASAGAATQTILVAEDDPAMRRATARTLRSVGYTVLEASGMTAALDLARAAPRAVDLLLTDVVMPGGSGGELAQRLIESFPEVRVLYMSGYAEDDIVRHRVLEQGFTLLQKPFAPDELVRTVAKALDTDGETGASQTA